MDNAQMNLLEQFNSSMYKIKLAVQGSWAYPSD